MKIKILTIFFFIIANNIYSQASWNYNVWFELLDENGINIDGNEYVNRDIKLLTYPSGAHQNSELTYNTSINKFKFTQHTVVTESILVFVHKNDTTKIRISTEDLYIKNIKLTGKNYNIDTWAENEKFTENYKSPNKNQSIIKTNSFPFEDYRTKDVNTYFKKHKINNFKIVELNKNSIDHNLTNAIGLANKNRQLTEQLMQLFSTDISAIYPIETNQYFIVRNFSSGNGNHYYDNISITYIAVGDEFEIVYHPLRLPENQIYGEDEIWHKIDDNGSLVFSQNQRISDFSPMVVTYDYHSRTLNYQYSYFESIFKDDKITTINGSYVLNNGKLEIK